MWRVWREFEADGLGADLDKEHPEAALNLAFDVVRVGGSIGIPVIDVGNEPGSSHPHVKRGTFDLTLVATWTKALTLTTGMAPVRKYSRERMQTILWNRIDLQSVLNTEVVSIQDGPEAYAKFSDGSAKKFVIDPNGDLT